MTEYELYMDSFKAVPSFTKVTSYVTTSFAMQHEVTFASEGIVTGTVYVFKLLARNVKGDSPFSEILSVAASDPPTKSSAPTVDYTTSTRT